ncbi:alpha/beta hydrolase fold domain-containing protein [Actinocorallia sp. A-T 12471]|uniref:alpha/beta hydrolase fold domain-containing protein n=1 Tax=Actinocorallia sp. A-T 12471 TaxID=3089813 RepID=UPI0029CDC992|nr:alpha/beta hydrolase fold domain-containing protein [Actinocorallia sp. A-T 12471]MDX6741051.1 alpha/beta hydrolase fold domain-containing protein [Actinocorallia sp. A-T 12471]
MASEPRLEEGPLGPVIHPPAPSGLVVLHLSGREEPALETAALWSAHTGATVVCARHRLTYPQALQDAQAAYEYCRTLGTVIVAGERIGASITSSLLVRLRDLGAPMPRGAILSSAILDLTLDAPSIAFNAGADPAFDAPALRATAASYASTTSPSDPLLSPLFANLHGLPPIQLLVSGTDPFIDDSLAFATRAARSAVPIELRVLPDSAHLRTRTPQATTTFLTALTPTPTSP